jgi:hypothetical protein
MSGEISTHGKMRKVFKFWSGNLKGERSLGRPRRRLEDNITTDLR